MAIELDKHNLRSYEIKQKKYKRKRQIVITVGTVVAVTVLFLAIFLVMNKNYNGYKVVKSIERSDSNFAKYLNYKSGILRYSRDGAVAMDKAGNLLWNGTYQMKDPIVDISGSFVAISDRGYKTVQIFNGEGGMKTIEVLHPIITTEIASQGVIAVLMEGKNINYIELFDKDGNSLVGIGTIQQDDGFPVDIALSENGRKLATSYVSITNGTVQSKVTFYNFGVGQNYVERMVGGFDYGKTLVADIEFINNDTLAAFGDDTISLYSMKEIPELVYQEKISAEIKSVLHNSKQIGIVVTNTEDPNTNTLILYDLSGKKKLEKMLDFEYETIYLSEKEIIMYSSQEWMIVRNNGKQKIHSTVDMPISYIQPSSGKNKYIIINSTHIQEVNLTD